MELIRELLESVVSLDAARKNKALLTRPIELHEIPEKEWRELFKDALDGEKIGDIAMHEQGEFVKQGVKVSYMEVGIYPYNGGAREIWLAYRNPKNPAELISEPVESRN